MSQSPFRPQCQQVLDFVRPERPPRLPQAVKLEVRDLLVRMLLEVIRAEPEERNDP